MCFYENNSKSFVNIKQIMWHCDKLCTWWNPYSYFKYHYHLLPSHIIT